MFKITVSGRCLSLLTAVAVAAIVPEGVEAETAPPLPSYNVNTKQMSVSGVSSGGYMAQQFHIAFSSNIMGAGIVAGGPYYCARGSIWIGLYGCMDTYFGNPPVDSLVQTTKIEAAQGTIDDPANMRDDKVYLFHGGQDSQINEAVMEALEVYYKKFLPAENIKYEKKQEAEHAMITEDYGSSCGEFKSPYINDCDVDVAGHILENIYGPLNRPVEPRGQIIEFDQTEFGANQRQNSLDNTGHAYIPTKCSDRSECKLHIAFHGCAQRSELIGNQYYTKTGYNKWAEANNIIILYPQVADAPLDWADFQHSNPQGCWDWWGYTGDNYHRKSGVQMAVVKKMIDRLTGASRASAVVRAANGRTATIYEHVIAGRATRCGVSDVCAMGSGKVIGSWLNLVQPVGLKESKPGFYEPAQAR